VLGRALSSHSSNGAPHPLPKHSSLNDTDNPCPSSTAEKTNKNINRISPPSETNYRQKRKGVFSKVKYSFIVFFVTIKERLSKMS